MFSGDASARRGAPLRARPWCGSVSVNSWENFLYALAAMSTGVPYIGSKISLITTSDIRYEGEEQDPTQKAYVKQRDEIDGCKFARDEIDRGLTEASTNILLLQPCPPGEPEKPSLAICMGSQDGVIELSLEVGGLRVTVSGPSSVAAEFVCFVSDFRPRANSPTSSLGSFTRVSVGSAAADSLPPRHSSPQLSSVRETRDQIAASFAPCPNHIRSLGSRLQGTDRTVTDRVERAWTAGQWAKAVLDQRVHSPNRTPPLDLRSRYYAVARCNNLELPTIFRSSGSYWRQIGGTLENSNSVSQSFPSETEASIYLRSAGFAEEDIQVVP
eukprot:s2559_g4.t1